jgi:hypothetical protein
MENKIVLHTKKGSIHKGVTQDFHPERPEFHLLPAEGGGVPMKFRLDDLKAVFYVKDYIGNRDFVARREFDEAHRADRRAVACFRDGEQIWGVLGEDDTASGPGFFFYPADKEDNNIRIFVVRSALSELKRIA